MEDTHLLVYSDGSTQWVGQEEKAGAGWASYHRGREVFWGLEGMGPKAEVYDAEMLALLRAISRAIRFAQDTQVTRLHFYVDNSSVVQAAYAAAPGPSQYIVLQIRRSLEDFLTTSPLHHVQIAWIPGHHNVVGNERADELAKEATRHNDTFHSTFANACRRNKEEILQKWTESWNRDVAAQTGRFTLANRLPPTLHSLPDEGSSTQMRVQLI
jgi:ribonuclease HI